MKNRSYRRQQDNRVKEKLEREFNSCLSELPELDRDSLGPDKMVKRCASAKGNGNPRKIGKRTKQEILSDLAMKEQIE